MVSLPPFHVGNTAAWDFLNSTHSHHFHKVFPRGLTRGPPSSSSVASVRCSGA